MGIWEKYKGPLYKKWKEYWYQTHPPPIAEYTWNYLFTGGKEIRARLFCELWYHLSPDSTVCTELAFAIECIHVASLILDDSPWMDNASERRGKKTLHLQFSEKKSLLICYDVMKIVYKIWLKNRPSSVNEDIWKDLLRNTLERLTIGQYYDLEKKGSLVVLASLKTGVLFGCVAETVAYCVGVDSNYWREWGIRLGVLFQWMDDWKDRQEDILQGNRNAFNEDYELTSMYYAQFWSDLIKVIGPSWFEREFGRYMEQYFTSIPIQVPKQVKISLHLPHFLPLCRKYTIPSPDQICIKLEKKKKIHNMSLPFETSFEMLHAMIHIIHHREEYEPLSINLWFLPEEEWESVPEVKAWIERVETEKELFMLYNK